MFGFPAITRHKDFNYKNNFLKTVTFQLNFDFIEFNDEIEMALKSLLLKKYSNSERLLKGTMEFSQQGITPTISEFFGLKFSNKESTINLTIQGDSFIYFINGSAYTNFYNFIKETYDEIAEISKLLNVIAFKRIAIRKVNVINFQLTEKKFSKVDVMGMIFNSGLVENMKIFPGSSLINSGLSNITMKKDNHRLFFTYGFLDDREEINGANAVLDIDLFAEMKVEIKDVAQQFELINMEIFNVFNWALQGPTIKKLND